MVEGVSHTPAATVDSGSCTRAPRRRSGGATATPITFATLRPSPLPPLLLTHSDDPKMNFAGISASLLAVVRPAILRPTLRVPSIASLDFNELKAQGVTGVVLDKDNCLVSQFPHLLRDACS